MSVEVQVKEFLYNELPANLGLYLEPKEDVTKAYGLFKLLRPSRRETRVWYASSLKIDYLDHEEVNVPRTTEWLNSLNSGMIILLRELFCRNLLEDSDGRAICKIPLNNTHFRLKNDLRALAEEYQLLAIFGEAADAELGEIEVFRKIAYYLDPAR